MREIKFRAWDKVNKRWVYFFVKHGEQPTPFWDADFLWVNLTPWQQYTGLKDKNGKEIYEGDILQDNIKKTKRYTVEYRDYCFCIKEIPNSVWLGATHEFMAVVGNIYENKDLLK